MSTAAEAERIAFDASSPFWCETTFQESNISYIWTIRNFGTCICSKTNGQCIKSTTFSSPKNAVDKNKWRLELYPKGTADQPSIVGLDLRLVSSSESEVSVKFRISIANDKTYLLPLQTKTVNVGCTVTEQLFEWEELLSRKEELLPGDTLTILCEIRATIESTKEFLFGCSKQSGIPYDLGRLLENQILGDVTIVAEDGKEIQAHKAILGARSPFFAAMFQNETGKNKPKQMKNADMDNNKILVNDATVPANGRELYVHKSIPEEKLPLLPYSTAMLENELAQNRQNNLREITTVSVDGRQLHDLNAILGAESPSSANMLQKKMNENKQNEVKTADMEHDDIISNDVTFVTEESKEFNSLTAIRGPNSPFSATILQKVMSENQQNKVKITDMEHDDILELLRFIYTGQVNLSHNAAKLLAAADKYELMELKDICKTKLSRDMTVESASSTLMLAELYSLEDLKERAIEFIEGHSDQVGKTEGWKKLTKDYPLVVMEAFLFTQRSRKDQRRE